MSVFRKQGLVYLEWLGVFRIAWCIWITSGVFGTCLVYLEISLVYLDLP
jgi:hypothetical protein